jgi:hypothetical protein
MELEFSFEDPQFLSPQPYTCLMDRYRDHLFLDIAITNAFNLTDSMDGLALGWR